MTESENIYVTDQMKSRIRELGNRYPSLQSALIPALWMIQHEYGYVSMKAMVELAEVFGIHRAHIQSVLSFYTMYFDKPVGKHLIQVCRSVSCMLRGSDDLISQIKDYLNIQTGETTVDGLFTLLEVECLGACGGAPVIQFDYDYHENMTWESTKELIDNFKHQTLERGDK